MEIYPFFFDETSKACPIIRRFLSEPPQRTSEQFSLKNKQVSYELPKINNV